MTHKQNKQMIVNTVLFLSILTVILGCNTQNKKIASTLVESAQNPEINMQAKKTPNIEENEINLIDFLDQENPKQENNDTIAQENSLQTISSYNTEEKNSTCKQAALEDLIEIIELYPFNNKDLNAPMRTLQTLVKKLQQEKGIITSIEIKKFLECMELDSKRLRKDLNILFRKNITKNEKKMVKKMVDRVPCNETSSIEDNKPMNFNQKIVHIKSQVAHLRTLYNMDEVLSPILHALEPTYTF